VQPVGHKTVSDPYTKEEMAIITRVARNQQSPNVTRQLAFVLGACRGAGAGASELRALRRKNVDDRGEEGVFITLGEGATKRTIPIRREWEAQMRRGIEGLSPSSLALGTVRNRRNIAGEIIDRTVALGNSCPHIEAGRLRTTWIAELMSEAIPVQVILNAAGLKGARTLTDLARRYTQEDMNECLGVLRGVA
jgi:integrase